MNPSTSSPELTDLDANGQPITEPVYDPSQVSIVSVGEPRYGLTPEPPQYAERNRLLQPHLSRHKL